MSSNSYLEIAESCTWLQKVYLHLVSLIYGTNHEFMKMNYPIDYYLLQPTDKKLFYDERDNRYGHKSIVSLCMTILRASFSFSNNKVFITIMRVRCSFNVIKTFIKIKSFFSFLTSNSTRLKYVFFYVKVKIHATQFFNYFYKQLV